MWKVDANIKQMKAWYYINLWEGVSLLCINSVNTGKGLFYQLNLLNLTLKRGWADVTAIVIL